jgi:hypothetical protein
MSTGIYVIAENSRKERLGFSVKTVTADTNSKE